MLSQVSYTRKTEENMTHKEEKATGKQPEVRARSAQATDAGKGMESTLEFLE